MISLNKKAQAAYPTSAFLVLATGLSSILTCVPAAVLPGLLEAPVADDRVFVRLLGSAWKVEDVAGREKRDSEEDEVDAVWTCCDDDDDDALEG